MTKPKLLTPIDDALIAAIQAKGLATALDEIIMDIGLGEPIPEKRLESLYAINNALLAACKDTADILNAATVPTNERHASKVVEGAMQWHIRLQRKSVAILWD